MKEDTRDLSMGKEAILFCRKCGAMESIGYRREANKVVFDACPHIELGMIHKPNGYNDTAPCGGVMDIWLEVVDDAQIAQDETLPNVERNEFSDSELLELVDAGSLPRGYFRCDKLRRQGKKQSEIAKAFNMTASNISNILSKGDETLKALLEASRSETY